MLKKRYIKRAYIEEAYCDKCGSKMEHTGVVLCTHPAQHSYNCTNKNCDGYTTFWSYNLPGVLRYEFEDEDTSPIAKLEPLPDNYKLKTPSIHTINTTTVEDI